MQTTLCPAGRLSLRLRTETRDEHEAVERCTGWPDSIGDGDDYRDCLKGLLSLWRPFEAALAKRRDWDLFAVGRHRRSRLSSLERDLRLLGEDPADVPSLAVTPPTGTAGLIGVLYVLEGSALGGRVILADILPRLRSDVAEATAFFSGGIGGPGPGWREIVEAIDSFGAARPADGSAVVSGARQTFAAFLRAFGGEAACIPRDPRPS